MAYSLQNLSRLLHTQGHYAQSEPLYLRALAVRKQNLVPDPSHTTLILNNLANLYRARGQYTQAESLLQRALTTSEKRQTLITRIPH